MKAILETTHLLRPWQEEDLNPLVRLLAKLEVARYIRMDGRAFTREETAQIHRRIVGSWNERGLGLWAAIDKTTGSWIGKLGLMYQEDWPGPDKFEVDYELDPAWWGEDWRPRACKQHCATGSWNARCRASSGPPFQSTSPPDESWRSVDSPTRESCGSATPTLCGMRSTLPLGGCWQTLRSRRKMGSILIFQTHRHPCLFPSSTASRRAYHRYARTNGTSHSCWSHAPPLLNPQPLVSTKPVREPLFASISGNFCRNLTGKHMARNTQAEARLCW
jgi:Acetyltransferase (GNAT) domain